jgi:hypothetical protein
MLDTIALTLDRQHFEVLLPERFSPSAQGLLSPPYYRLGSRGNFVCVQNPTKSDLQAGRYRPRLTLSKRKISTGFALTLRIEFSASKLILGNNFDEIETRDFPKVLAVLYQRLLEMGIKLSRDVLRNAPVSTVHYSKNIAFTDYTTCSMVISELQRIDLTKRLDLSKIDYRNAGHAIRYHANSFEVIFYDKLKDLDHARYSEKRGLEQDYGLQLEMFSGPGSLPRELEVLRIEVRLGTRAKIKSTLKRIDANLEPTFAILFDAAIAKSILGQFWAQIRAQLPLIDAGHPQRPEQMLANIALATKGKVRPGKLLQQLGSTLLVASVGIRGAGAVLSRHCSPRSWQRYKRDLKSVSVSGGGSGFSAMKQIEEALTRFEPLRMKSFRSQTGRGSFPQNAH